MCGMMPLKTELHCHNIFSNGHVGALEPIYDCNVTIPKQLEQAYLVGLDVLFVTNHNTIGGYVPVSYTHLTLPTNREV